MLPDVPRLSESDHFSMLSDGTSPVFHGCTQGSSAEYSQLLFPGLLLHATANCFTRHFLRQYLGLWDAWQPAIFYGSKASWSSSVVFRWLLLLCHLSNSPAYLISHYLQCSGVESGGSGSSMNRGPRAPEDPSGATQKIRQERSSENTEADSTGELTAGGEGVRCPSPEPHPLSALWASSFGPSGLATEGP